MITWIEIDKNAIRHNLRAFRSHIGNSPLLMPVIKSNAYGHGIVEVGRICDEASEVDRLAVVNLDEALLLRVCGIKKPIHILSFFEKDDNKVIEAMKKGVIFPLYTLEQARYLNRIGESTGLTCLTNLKIDCGTSRVGVVIEGLSSFLKEISHLKYLRIEGLWSHFSSSESDAQVTRQQFKLLRSAEDEFKNFGLSTPMRHIACTAASILHDFSHLDAVRIGLGIYGLHPSLKTKNKISLKPVLSWKTTISQIKKLPKGAAIGYGGSYIMKKTGVVAVLPVGYYDGYDRAWSNKAEVLINGVRCPVRGRVCMNLTMVDVSKVKNCKAGDTVILLGKDGKDEITADELASLSPDTINYEIVTRINPLLPRSVI